MFFSNDRAELIYQTCALFQFMDALMCVFVRIHGMHLSIHFVCLSVCMYVFN